jgi:alpha-ketoglutarate-dependent dioxygenase alkB family protein 2
MNLLEPIDIVEPQYYLFRKFIKSKKSKKIMDYFNSYQFDDSYVKIAGKTIKIPRNQVAFGDDGTFYRFTGTTVYSKNWLELDEEIKVIFEKIRKRLSKIDDFNFVLVNHYEDENKYIGFHSDDTRDLKTTNIASISCGASRRFVMKHKKSGKIVEITLNDGDLILMHGNMQNEWLHSVPKEKNHRDPRINLTFRVMKM